MFFKPFLTFIDNKGLQPTWRKLNSNAEVTGKKTPNILYVNKLSLSDDGVYLCKTINKNNLLTEVGFKVHVNEHDGKVSLISLNETILPDEIQPMNVNENDDKNDESGNHLKKLPNIKITFSDKLALARGERVEITCLTDSDASIEWMKVRHDGELDFLTKSNNFLREPIRDEDLGRYRCIATNKHGSRSRDAYLSKPNGFVEFIVYGFVDKHTDLGLEQDQNGDTHATTHFKGNSYTNSSESDFTSILRVESPNEKGELQNGKDIRFECLNGNRFRKIIFEK